MNIGNNLRNDNDYTKITTTGKPNGEKNRKTKVESSQPSFSYFFPKGNSHFYAKGKSKKVYDASSTEDGAAFGTPIT